MGANASTNAGAAGGAGGGKAQKGGVKAAPAPPLVPVMDPKDPAAYAEVAGQLQELLEKHPYLEVGKAAQPHPLSRWVNLCRESLKSDEYDAARAHIGRVQVGLRAEMRPIAEAFRRFDSDGSGQLDASEFRHLCAYLGWGDEEADLMDLDGDGKVSLDEFQSFVGAYGGVQQLFEQRRLRISSSRKDVCDFAGIAVGSRVQAHFYIKGQKSKTWREAVVLAVGCERPSSSGMGPITLGVKLEFGFSPVGEEATWRAQQVVPPSWIISGVEDASIASALREVGILEEQQSFWSLLLPETEMQALANLEGCQRAALSLVRSQATESHEEALPKLRKRFVDDFQLGEMELQAMLDWVQDLAPIVVHVHLDTIGPFMEVDDYYRSQFETKTSCGAGDGDQANHTRRGWEHELFGGVYDDAKAFDRCKYGALNVMNDWRGVVTAQQYGDSYLVLKDVRLRCTFASEDSGGIEGSRLAVLDKYAHVLNEYSNEELRDLVAIATSAIAPDREALSSAGATIDVLRGSSQDPVAEWITMGFPKKAQSAGRYYFEVTLFPDTGAPQVGILSTAFHQLPTAYSQEGVGDDANGWAIDVMNAALWHNGKSMPYSKSLPTKMRDVEVPGPYPWSRLTVKERGLEAEATIGVAVDVDKGQIWFSCDGSWTIPPSMTFPKGKEVYPAVSLKGRAAFIFSGKFKYKQPDHTGRFALWPGMGMKVVRVDCPHLGNEETLDCYKEVQIHGPVSLKRNVQRLVAASKYRNKPKSDRSLALRVLNAGMCDGTYQRAGCHNDMPLYHGTSGGCLFYDAAAKAWRMNDKKDTSSWLFYVNVNEQDVPPRRGWQVKDEESSAIDAAAFEKHIQEAGVATEAAKELVQALAASDAHGNRLVYRKRGDCTLSTEWEKLHCATSAEEVWNRTLESVLRSLQSQRNLTHVQIVESEHPYDLARPSWRKEVRIDGAMSLKVHFATKSSTYDSSSQFRIYAGGMSRTAAGPGARVEVSTPNGHTVWGTVTSHKRDGAWHVKLDRRPQAGQEEEESELDEFGISRWPAVGDAVEAQYKSGRWYEATVADIDIEVDWYTASRKAIYTVAWKDGDTADREKTWDKLRRLPGAIEGLLEGHHYLEEVPLYGGIPPVEKECHAICAEEPTVVYANYGEDLTEEFTYTDEDDDEVTLRLCAGQIECECGDDSSIGSSFEIAFLGTEQFRLCVPLGESTVKVPASGEAAEVFVAKLVAAARRTGVEVVASDAGRLESLVTKYKTTETTKAGTDNSIGAEIQSFALDLSCPLAPITIAAFAAGGGPAQSQGVKVGWYLDLLAALRQSEYIRKLVHRIAPGVDASNADRLLETALKSPQEFLGVFNGPMLNCSGVRLTFCDSCMQSPVKLLPEAYVHYTGKRVSSEVKLFQTTNRKVSVEAFQQVGPAQEAGVRTDWVLDIHKTLHFNPEAAKQLTEEAIIENPNTLLAWSDVLLVFKQPSPSKTLKQTFKDHVSTWERCELPGDCAEFEFVTNCDGQGGDAKDRWGVFAVVANAGGSQPSQKQVDDLAERWAEVTNRARWVKDPEVLRDDWDEARLRALCAKHGWEFEWMTEDGERKRRVREIGRLRKDDGLASAAKSYLQSQHSKVSVSTSGASALPDGAVHAEDDKGAEGGKRWKKAEATT